MTSIKFHVKGNTNCSVKSSLSHRYEQLLNSEKYYDCLFNVCGTEVRCHKLILGAASPVFDAMFYGPLKEQHPLEIEILDISADIFQILINYIYTGIVNYELLTLAQTIELLYSAEKYLLDELNDECLQAAENKLRFANILPAFELSVCMHLDKLIKICLKFFQHYCLSADAQFSNFLQPNNYVHISKECLKTILANLPTEQKHQMLWFILIWCQHECQEYSLQTNDIPLLLVDLQLQANLSALHELQIPHSINAYKRDRLYYKASRPFYVDDNSFLWKLQLKCDRFIQLLGITMHSRLKPQSVKIVSTGSHAPTMSIMNLPDDYKEELSITISSLNARRLSNSDEESDNDTAEPFAPQPLQNEQSAVIWQHTFVERAIKYNCDININWDTGVVLSPDLSYEITFKWNEPSFGAEYPCSLLSNEIDGIHLQENNGHAGSMIKGLRFSDFI